VAAGSSRMERADLLHLVVAIEINQVDGELHEKVCTDSQGTIHKPRPVSIPLRPSRPLLRVAPGRAAHEAALPAEVMGRTGLDSLRHLRVCLHGTAPAIHLPRKDPQIEDARTQ